MPLSIISGSLERRAADTLRLVGAAAQSNGLSLRELSDALRYAAESHKAHARETRGHHGGHHAAPAHEGSDNPAHAPTGRILSAASAAMALSDTDNMSPQLDSSIDGSVRAEGACSRFMWRAMCCVDSAGACGAACRQCRTRCCCGGEGAAVGSGHHGGLAESLSCQGGLAGRGSFTWLLVHSAVFATAVSVCVATDFFLVAVTTNSSFSKQVRVIALYAETVLAAFFVCELFLRLLSGGSCTYMFCHGMSLEEQALKAAGLNAHEHDRSSSHMINADAGSKDVSMSLGVSDDQDAIVERIDGGQASSSDTGIHLNGDVLAKDGDFNAGPAPTPRSTGTAVDEALETGSARTVHEHDSSETDSDVSVDFSDEEVSSSDDEDHVIATGCFDALARWCCTLPASTYVVNVGGVGSSTDTASGSDSDSQSDTDSDGVVHRLRCCETAGGGSGLCSACSCGPCVTGDAIQHRGKSRRRRRTGCCRCCTRLTSWIGRTLATPKWLQVLDALVVLCTVVLVALHWAFGESRVPAVAAAIVTLRAARSTRVWRLVGEGEAERRDAEHALEAERRLRRAAEDEEAANIGMEEDEGGSFDALHGSASHDLEEGKSSTGHG